MIELVILAGLAFLGVCLEFLLDEHNVGKDKSDD